MRLFIAIRLPEALRKKVFAAAAPLRDRELPVRWVDVENYHLTLKFLGEVRAERVPILEKVLGRIADQTQAFSVDLGGFGAFPTIRRPRVLWLGVEASPALRCLKQDIEWGLAELGFDRETRAFHPHLTLGRCDVDSGAGVFRGLDELTAEMEFKGSAKVRSVDLMRSQLSREGTRYTVLKEAPLEGSAEG